MGSTEFAGTDSEVASSDPVMRHQRSWVVIRAHPSSEAHVRDE